MPISGFHFHAGPWFLVHPPPAIDRQYLSMYDELMPNFNQVLTYMYVVDPLVYTTVRNIGT